MNMRKVMLFAYDGTGLGHLMRLVKIAWGLSEECQVMVVSGHKAMPDIIPEEIQYYLLPNFSELREEKRYTNEQTNKVRIKILENLIIDFMPDVFVTDYLPLGKRCELARIITSYNCLKYFVLRSDIGGDRLTHEDVFSNRNIAILKRYYHRILLASDPIVTSLEVYSWLPTDILDMIVYIGCVTYPVSTKQIIDTRLAYLTGHTQKWMVCSAGGGRISQDFSKKCIEMAKDKRFADWKIDIILGNYSQLPWPYGQTETFSIGNITIHRKLKNLYLLHASADCVICAGGYNSLIESMQGKDKYIFAYSVMDFAIEEEQVHNIRNFGKYYPITEIPSLNSMADLIFSKTLRVQSNDNISLNLNGIENAKRLIIEDLEHFHQPKIIAK